MLDPARLLFIHGSDSSSQTYKAGILRGVYPGMVIPDFTGSLEERMRQLETILARKTGWTLIGSSLGGLMAVLFSAGSPGQVRMLVLLAPALTLPEFTENLPTPLSIPTLIVHGTQDDLVPLEPVRELAEKVFKHLTYQVVDDDHRLHKTTETMDWKAVLESE